MNKEKLKKMIKQVILENREKSILLESPMDESTFGSVKDRISGDTKRPERQAEEFVVMSSDRGERSNSENKRKYIEFKRRVKNEGFPFSEFVGSWVETDEKTGKKRRVKENTIIIYGETRPDSDQSGDAGLFELAKEFSKIYNQEAFIYGELVQSRGGPSRMIRAYDSSGKVLDWGGPWSSMEAVKDDAPFWSKVRGKGSAFQFVEENNLEEVVEVDAPNSYMEAMRKASEHKGKKVKFIRRKK